MTTWDTNLKGKKVKKSKTDTSEIEFLKNELNKKEAENSKLKNDFAIKDMRINELSSEASSWESDYDNLLTQNRERNQELSEIRVKLNRTKHVVLPEWLTYKDIASHQIIIMPFDNSLWLFKKLDIYIKNIRFYTTNNTDNITKLKGNYRFPKNSYIGLNISNNQVQRDGIFLIDSDNQISYYYSAHSVNQLCATYKRKIESLKDYLHAIYYIKMEFETINLGSPYSYSGFTPGFKKIFNKVLIEAIQIAPLEAMSGNYLRSSGEDDNNYCYRHISKNDLVVREENINNSDDNQN